MHTANEKGSISRKVFYAAFIAVLMLFLIFFSFVTGGAMPFGIFMMPLPLVFAITGTTLGISDYKRSKRINPHMFSLLFMIVFIYAGHKEDVRETRETIDTISAIKDEIDDYILKNGIEPDMTELVRIKKKYGDYLIEYNYDGGYEIKYKDARMTNESDRVFLRGRP